MLARREYPAAELRARLVARGAPAAEVDAELQVLQADGYLSDARYAAMRVAGMAGRYARRAIAHRLREDGVGDDARATMEATLAAVDDAADARALLLRRFPEPAGDDREKARQVRFLQSRGYALALVLRILRERGTAVDD
ncbi:MAG: regulatory protein RecX [Proteobacteria bacterium]|nr:regulatory protein RecX [Pseudomonadota bacterium]